jgi:hypothetical protein
MPKEMPSRLDMSGLRRIRESRPEPPPASPNERPAHARQTFYLPPRLIEKIRDVAYHERLTIADVVAPAIQEYIGRLEKKRGAPYPRREGRLRPGKPLA